MIVDEIAFIGDVHGEARALEDVLGLAMQRVRRLVFLGDLVNRGPSSKRVLEIVAELRADSSFETVLLAGNHDQALLEVLDGATREDEFLRMGGAATIRSYVDPPYRDVFGQLRAAMPASHKQLLESLIVEWRSGHVVARHRLNGSDETPRGTFVIAGHAVQRDRNPRVDGSSALIDTGCGTVGAGRLTAFYWPSRTWDQVEVSRE